MIPDKRQAQLVGSGGFSASPTTRWDSGADVEPEGSAVMSRICVFFPIRRLRAIAQEPFGKRVGAWFFHWGNNRTYRFYINDGGSTQRNATIIPTAIPQKDECVVWMGSYNEAELICYARGESNVTGPYVGFTASNGNVYIGYRNSIALDFGVITCLATDTHALTVAECATAEAAIKEMLEQGQRINPAKLPGSGWGWIWDARDIHKEKKGEWKDQESDVILSEVGETQLHAVQARF